MSVKGFLIDVENSNPYIAEIDGSIESYYQILKCDMFDIATRRIGENYYDIYCDDEGLLKCKPLVSAISSLLKPMTKAKPSVSQMRKSKKSSVI